MLPAKHLAQQPQMMPGSHLRPFRNLEPRGTLHHTEQDRTATFAVLEAFIILRGIAQSQR